VLRDAWGPSFVAALGPERGYTGEMHFSINQPLFFFLLVFVILLIAGWIGSWLRSRYTETLDPSSSSFKTLESSVLGLLALLLGFSFAMAVSRYDARKDLEVGEANAIGTTWLRAATLDEPARSTEQALLKEYVAVRLQFVSAGTDPAAIADCLAKTGAVQDKLWSVAATDASAHRDAITGLFVATLNDTIDFSEKRTAAWENRIPGAAWLLLVFMSAVASALVGIGTTARSRALLLVLPVVVGAVLMLIADLDSSRGGFVQVQQKSMERVAAQVNSAK
jgi:hypothetical protein